uniref:Putative PD-(D/E)XK nuclease superfamily protein n=2 Tax=viral metagenome TaxID=1070528 RepID=A0A6M3XTS2_9ZZZZ
MNYTNTHNLPDPLVQALIRDDYDAGGADISVTALVGPPRIRQLRLWHAGEIVVDVADNLWLLLGTMGHLAIQHAAVKDGLSEERLYMRRDGCLISGKPDLWLNNGLTDWKFTSVWAVLLGLKADWEAQLNVYRPLYLEAGFPVDTLNIWAILRDWKRGDYRRDPKRYPPVPFQVVPVPIWSDDKLDKYLSERVAAHQAANNLPDNELPPCTPEERWARSNTWAVMREGRKTAVRVKNSQDEAEAVMKEKNKKPKAKKHHVVFRPGASVRCEEGFCEVAPFCNQYQEMKGGENAD